MSQDRQDDEIAFLSIFVKGGGAAGAANLAAARAAAREAREAEKQATATMSLTKQHRAQKKRNAAEKAMKATRDVTQQGFESALHLQRPKGGNTVNRAAIGGRMVDNYQDAKRAAAASSSGLPVALVAGDRVQTAMGAGTVKKLLVAAAESLCLSHGVRSTLNLLIWSGTAAVQPCLSRSRRHIAGPRRCTRPSRCARRWPSGYLVHECCANAVDRNPA